MRAHYMYLVHSALLTHIMYALLIKLVEQLSSLQSSSRKGVNSGLLLRGRTEQAIGATSGGKASHWRKNHS